MGDVSLLKQLWRWLESLKQSSMGFSVGHHSPLIFRGCGIIRAFLQMVLGQWLNCANRGFRSLIGLGSAVIFLILWSCFLYCTSISCSVSALIVLGAASQTVQRLGYASGMFIAGLFGILAVWIYGSIWVAGTLFITGSYMLFLNQARTLVLLIAVYCVYSICIQTGWIGFFLTANLAFISDDLLICFLQGYEPASKAAPSEETKTTDPQVTDDHDIPSSKPEDVDSAKPVRKPIIEDPPGDQTCSPSVSAKPELSSLEEMKRIMRSLNHYETLCFPQFQIIDLALLKKEYRRKAVLVHPDKNMGNSLASETFKKLQTAYEVLADEGKRRAYDEQLRREVWESGSEAPRCSSYQQGMEYQSDESRRVECTKCGNIHIWICTSRLKSMARWCQECRHHHPASDGDGWIELGSSLFDSSHGNVEIPRAFVCAEGKIFDVSEWAICQGMTCRPNTHKPSFQVTMTGPTGLDARMVSEEEEEFEIWFQEALAAGLFSEPRRRRKSWSPFKIRNKNAFLRQLRRFS